MASVRARVTAAAAAATALVLAATGWLLVEQQVRTLRDSLDERLEADAAAIEERQAAEVSGPFLGPFGDDDTVAQVVSQDGSVLATTMNAEGIEPIQPFPTVGIVEPHGIGHLPTDEARYRAMSRVMSLHGDPVAIHVAATTDDITESATVLRSSLLVVVPVVTGLLALLTWWMVGRTLRPVDAIRSEVDEIRGGQLHRRVPVPPSRDEVARLATTMNEMLDRVDDASQRQQRFVSDASHELRSPLTRMRAELEVDVHHPQTADLAATHRSVLEETIGLQALVEDLLHLARSDAGATPPHDEVVDLAEVVREVAGHAGSDGAAVDLSAVEPVVVRGDRAALRRAVANLLDNAQRHAASTVRMATESDDRGARVVVSDDGTGVPVAERARIFERFAQLDDARHSGGTGLGLAIVAEVAASHGGTVAVDDADGGGARFTLNLPT